MTSARAEPWGRIVYDPAWDEFVAEVCENLSMISISRPLSAGCLVTGRCNLRCAYCYGNDESLPKEELSVDRWAQVFRHLHSWGLMRVDLSGGEPTIRKDLRDIAAAAIEAGLSVVISSNGLVLGDKGPTGFPPVRWHVSLDSGLEEIHASSRVLRNLLPSGGSFRRTSEFIATCCDQGYRVRVLTCIGPHNREALFALGEHLALAGVVEWNISRILRAGRAQADFHRRWAVRDEEIIEQVHDLRKAFPFLMIRYSNRTEQNGYFLLVLPDGSLATQYTDGRDKVILGPALDMSLEQLRAHPDFHLAEHGRKWIAATLECQQSECFSHVLFSVRSEAPSGTAQL